MEHKRAGNYGASTHIYQINSLPLNKHTTSGAQHPNIFRSIVVSMRACHARDPGSIPGGRVPPNISGVIFLRFFLLVVVMGAM